jgi:S1-C subfamily serine protease
MMHRKLLGLLAAVLLAAPAFAQQKPDAGPAAPAQDPGVLVVAVQPGSPAQKAGLARGDIILEANGTAVNDAADLRQTLAGRSAGDTVALKVRHGDAQKSLSVTVGTRDGRPWIGILPLAGRGDELAFGPGMGGYGMRGYGMMFPAEGALVEGVTPNSPAEKAGLKKGDLILSVDGTTVDARNPLADLVSSKKVGDTVTLSVAPWGQQASHDVKVTLVKNPDKDAAWLGLQYLAAPARFFGPEARTGALVVQVTADGPAAKAGVEARDVVTKIDGKDVTDPQQIVDAVAAHKPGDKLALTLLHRADGKTTEVTVTLGKSPNDAAKAWLGVSLRGFGPGVGPMGPNGFGPGMRGNPPGAGPSARTL